MRKPNKILLYLVNFNLVEIFQFLYLSFSNFSLMLVYIPKTESGTWKTPAFTTDLFPYPTQRTRFLS